MDLRKDVKQQTGPETTQACHSVVELAPLAMEDRLFVQ